MLQRIVDKAVRMGALNGLSDEAFVKFVFRVRTGLALNLKNPERFGEKLQWLKLYAHKSEYTKYADKLAVRDFVREKIGEQYLIPLLGAWERPEQIPWAQLPPHYAIKCNHGSHCGQVVHDSSALDTAQLSEKLNGYLARNWYEYGRERQYKDIPPRILCEELVGQPGELPIDYKVMCFQGKAQIIQVHDKHAGHHGAHNITFFDPHGQVLPKLKRTDCPPLRTQPLEGRLDEMCALAEVLAEGIEYVRVDFYQLGDRVYFGEMTFHDTSGFFLFDDEAQDKRVGAMIRTPTA